MKNYIFFVFIFTFTETFILDPLYVYMSYDINYVLVSNAYNILSRELVRVSVQLISLSLFLLPRHPFFGEFSPHSTGKFLRDFVAFCGFFCLFHHLDFVREE